MKNASENALVGFVEIAPNYLSYSRLPLLCHLQLLRSGKGTLRWGRADLEPSVVYVNGDVHQPNRSTLDKL